MREILFRGKSTETGEWLYGSLIQRRNNGASIVVPKGHTGADGVEDSYSYPVEPATVGQYIGLKNKKGDKFFDGDVVEMKVSEPIVSPPHSETDEFGMPINPVMPHYESVYALFVITYDERKCCFFLKRIKTPGCSYEFLPYNGNALMADTLKIIGNIHDNQDLMSPN